MKQLNLQTKVNNSVIAIFATITAFFTIHPAYAQLANAKKALENLQTDLISNIAPVAAAVILLCLAIGYAGRYIEKDTFVRWAVGVVIAGSAIQLTTMLFKPN
ncbi:VirB2 family type IV secretion system major pilin TrwL [Bartonella taylorii]|uniref:VirB2 family type IV secretion system major pilin TrwL n=1 Tax=Bartonella taylorii TaxID=33046 RepID=A0A9Q8YX05_BARTA|nr:VirB2 family type IV secretion system major pilin TrwL [Bartonella taylorii]USP02372.1 VirB2 family type IV secretion system major pilin TrwL [Bartonella taylorii]